MEKIRACVAACAVRPRCGAVVAACALAGGFGALWGRVEVDALKLWVDARAREEVKTYEDAFGDYRTQAFVVTAKRAPTLASREAFLELKDWHDWMYGLEAPSATGSYTLHDFCYKYVDSEPHTPCFQITPLDCFAEGAVSAPGGAEKNDAFAASYSVRPSVASFDFEKDFNQSFARGCKQWFNLATPSKVLFSGLREDANGLDAMRVVFQTRDAASLAARGVVRTTFTPTQASAVDVLGCRAGTPSLEDCSCIETFNLFSVLEYGCVPEGDAEQPPTCCEYMARLREHPCVETLWMSDATLFALGNQVFTTCGIARISFDSQCVRLPNGETLRKSSTSGIEDDYYEDLSASTPVTNVFECGFKLRSLQTKCPLIAEGNYTAASECCASLETFALSKCHCGDLHCGGRSRPCESLFARDDVGQIVQFCTLSGFSTPSFDVCGRNTSVVTPPAKRASKSASTASTLIWVPAHERRELSKEDAEDLLLGWESLWLSQIDAKIANYEHISIAYMSQRSTEDIIAAASRGAFVLLFIGYFTVAFYVVTYFHLSPNAACGPRAAVEGVSVVALSTWASLGLSAALSRISGVTFNAITLQVLPFLSLGLGVNDFFVLASHAAAATAELEDSFVDGDSISSNEDILVRTLRDGGTSVTLSSAMNFAAFLLGAISPVPAVRNFGIQIACAVACNYIVALLVFPGILYRHLERRSASEARRVSEDVECTTPLRRDSSFAKISSAVYEPFVRWRERLIAAPRASTALRLAVLAMYGVFAVYLIAGIPTVRLGLEMRDVIPSDSYMAPFVAEMEHRFATYPVFVFVSNVDFARYAVALRELERDFLDVAHVDATHGSTNFMIYYTEYAESRVAGGHSCSLNDTRWYYDATRAAEPYDSCAADALDENQTFTCMVKCLAHVPQTQSKRCEFHKGASRERSRCYCPHRLIYNEDAFVREFPAFLAGGQRGEISRAFTTLGSNASIVTSARLLFYVEDVFDVDDKLAHIRQARSALKNSDIVARGGARAFPFDVALYAMNEQYLNIKSNTWRALIIGLVTSTIIMFVAFRGDVRATMVASATLAFTQAELFGAMGRFNVKLNGASMANLIISTGVVNEFIAHMSRAFFSSDRRAGAAFASIAPALFNAGVTTFLGVIPSAFARYEYFRVYFFSQWCVILLFAVANGVVFLPIALSLFA